MSCLLQQWDEKDLYDLDFLQTTISKKKKKKASFL